MPRQRIVAPVLTFAIVTVEPASKLNGPAFGDPEPHPAKRIAPVTSAKPMLVFTSSLYTPQVARLSPRREFRALRDSRAAGAV